MRYKSFRIQNFKGIKDTTISFQGSAGAAVFAFVGLNESGKTTILEAIHSFSPDTATNELVGGGENQKEYSSRVPRHLISSFTGYVEVEATLTASADEKAQIVERALLELDLKIDTETLNGDIIFARQQRFKGGDFLKSFFSLRKDVQVKSGRERKWRSLAPGEEHQKVRDLIYSYTPDIAYFPTFVFDFPKTIFLTERGGKLDRFYRRVFQDILDYDGLGHTIEEDIVRRVRGEGMTLPWIDFLTSWTQHDDRTKIQHVMDRAGAAVTKLVFGKWNQIFREDARGKEIVVSFDTEEGERRDTRGAVTKTQEHDLYIKFQVRDGTRRFNVNDRSLGFRWFFAFMLFTQFRVARKTTRALLFLFDEPASNLHAAAQQKLIESFPEIATGEHTLAYTTHSHYMIEPRWLEQTYIVTNRADAPSDNSVIDQLSLDDESLDVRATSYRSFVNAHPSQTSYFQPILDRLEVIPSRFDIRRKSVILEGRSDYYILRYALALHKEAELHFLPGLGAGTFGALAALHVGWNLDFLFLLDGDRQGRFERSRYTTDYGIPENKIITLDMCDATLTVIEDLLDAPALNKIKADLKLGADPNKNQIRRYFQERLAGGNITQLSPSFSSKSAHVLKDISGRLG